MIFKKVWPRIVTDFLYTSHIDIPTSKMLKDTNSWVLEVTVAMVTEALGGRI